MQNLNWNIQRTSKVANHFSHSCHNTFPNHLYTLHNLDAYKLVSFLYLDHVYWSEMHAERKFSTSSRLSCSHNTSFCILVHYTKRSVILCAFCVLCMNYEIQTHQKTLCPFACQATHMSHPQNYYMDFQRIWYR